MSTFCCLHLPPQRSCRRWETGRSRTSGRPPTPGITRRSWPSWWTAAGPRTLPRGPTSATSRSMWPNSTSKTSAAPLLFAVSRVCQGGKFSAWHLGVCWCDCQLGAVGRADVLENQLGEEWTSNDFDRGSAVWSIGSSCVEEAALVDGRGQGSRVRMGRNSRNHCLQAEAAKVFTFWTSVKVYRY